MSTQPTPAALRAAKRLCQCGLLFHCDIDSAASVLDAELAQVAALRERARELEDALELLLNQASGLKEFCITYIPKSRENARALIAKCRADREGSK